MEKKKLQLSITGSSKKTLSSIEQAKSKSRNTVVIEKKSSKFSGKSQSSRQSNDNSRQNKIISKPSNVLLKITIVEGWSQNQLDLELSKYFTDFNTIPYQDIIADTYYLNKDNDFDLFLKKLENFKTNYSKCCGKI